MTDRRTFQLPGSTRGVRCSHCNCGDLRVYMTRKENNRVRRVRICRHCEREVTTLEVPVADETPPTVH